jgi:hypothetical protein
MTTVRTPPVTVAKGHLKISIAFRDRLLSNNAQLQRHHCQALGGLTSIVSWANVAENLLFNSIDMYAQNLISLFQYRGHMALGLCTSHLYI